jgi:RNA polymerase sigma factor (sigma-70 family)
LKSENELKLLNEYYFDKENDKYEKTYKNMQWYFLKNSYYMNLYQILERIIKYNDKDYIYNFIHCDDIKKIIQCIKNFYKINRDEATDIIEFVITEFFYITDKEIYGVTYKTMIDLNNFNENIFINDFKDEIAKRTKKIMRNGYSIRDIPVIYENLYQNVKNDDFEEVMIKNIDLNNALNKLSFKNKIIIKQKFYSGLLEKEIANENNMTRQGINNIIKRSFKKIKKYLQD